MSPVQELRASVRAGDERRAAAEEAVEQQTQRLQHNAERLTRQETSAQRVVCVERVAQPD
jgi:hypothetical protein